jgi:predicted DNA-binding protein
LEGLLLDQETDGYVRMAVATGLAQMTLQSPDTREAVEKILKKMFDFILEEENIQRIKDLEAIFEGSEYEIDLEFISNLVADALQADMKRFQGQIEEIFEQDLVDAEIITPEDMRFRTHLQKISDIFALYQELIEMESEEESLEEDEEDKPKIRKMKD